MTLDPNNREEQTAPFLLEIGSEEIPARFIPEARRDLEQRARESLTLALLAPAGFQVLATPRRMALLVDSLLVRQPDRVEEIKGPPVKVAFTKDGEPTPAALGFARKAGVDLADCQRRTDDRGEFLVASKQVAGKPAVDILAALLPEIILAVPFRKIMRWGDHELEYPRPLQWLVALLGKDEVRFTLDYLQSGRTSRGHRTLAQDQAVEITDPLQYQAVLRDAGVIVDQQVRRSMIQEGFATLLTGHDPEARLLEDEELLTEVVHLCEHPTVFLGSFAEEFFALPPEVITTALKAHQRYFSVGSRRSAGLLPCFVAVRDGGSDHLDTVIGGNERVLRARLADALFYWEFDQKKSPDERTALLGSVTWLEGFGSLLDKTRRLGGLVGWLWSQGMGDTSVVPVDLLRAAEICKGDLVSEMIKDGKEFTKLEGFIGARYAALAGESSAVCRAVERHYLPRTAADELPGDPLSSTLAVADRLDNLAGCWLAGFQPTGAKDPYALRRSVLGMLRILLATATSVDLERALAQALQGVVQFAADQDLAGPLTGLGDFIRTRMEIYFSENLACDAQIVRAVLPVRWRDPVACLAWIGALAQFRSRKDFLLLATGFKRCRNILEGSVLPMDQLDDCLNRWLAGGQGAGGEDLGALPAVQEQELRAQVGAAVSALREAENAGDFVGVLGLLSGIGPAIDEFFDSVRVNVPDQALREVRHAFLREIHGLFARYADFSYVAPDDQLE